MKSSPSSKWLTRLRRGVLAYAMSLPLLTTTVRGEEPLPQLALVFADEVLPAEEVARRYDVVIWHNDPKIRDLLAQVKQHKPSVKGLMYRELFCVLQEEAALGESVGHYRWILAHHPKWFQRDAQGRMVEVPDYPGRWMMDLGNPEWQQFWIDQTLPDVVAGGWDGVFVDDALTKVRAHNLPPLAGYPDDASLQQAVYQFLTRISTAFHKAGKLVIANVSTSYDFPGLWERWLEVTDGLTEEHFAGEGWTWGSKVAQRQLEAMRRAERMGKWMLVETDGSWEDRDRMRNSLAAYLVAAGTRSYWSYRPEGRSHGPMRNPSWDVHLGRPLEDPEVHDGVWQRRFEHGLVGINTTTSPHKLLTDSGPISLQSHEGTIIGDDGALTHRQGIVMNQSDPTQPE